MSVAQLDFNNTKVAFQLKTDSELERAYFLFKMISFLVYCLSNLVATMYSFTF